MGQMIDSVLPRERAINVAITRIIEGDLPGEVRSWFFREYPEVPKNTIKNYIREAVSEVQDAYLIDIEDNRAIVICRLWDIYKRCSGDPRIQLKALEQISAITGLKSPIKLDVTTQSESNDEHDKIIANMTREEMRSSTERYREESGRASKPRENKFPPLVLSDGTVIDGKVINNGEKEKEEVEEEPETNSQTNGYVEPERRDENGQDDS